MKPTSLFPIWLLFLLSVPVFLHAQPGFGQPEKINADWLFHLGDVKNGETPDINDQSWQRVNLPHDWSVKQALSPSLASATGYLPGGIGWYRKKLTVPKDSEGKKTFLYFEGVYNRSEVFINGHSLGIRPNGYISFLYDATPYIRYGAENIIAVRVDHSKSADSRWYTGSGIYRDVWLVSANPVHIDQWGVYAYPQVKGNQASLHTEISLTNSSSRNASLTIRNELIAPDGRTAANKTSKIAVNAGNGNKVKFSLAVKQPQLWSLNSPALYKLRTTVLQDGKVIDQSVVTTGFRTFTFDPGKGFALNGQWMKIKGVCLHHDSGVLGAEVYPEVWRRRLLTLKELGCNAIRTSHNPQAPGLYALCDELGLLVMNEAFDEWEFPKRKWLEGWNVGTPGFDGNFDFFKEWGEKDLADMVKRDRNHLSVFAWSIGNEVDYPNDPYSHPVLDGSREGGFTQPIFGGYKKDAPDAGRLGDIAKRLAAVVRTYDRSRPVTAGLAGVAMSNETEYPSALDIAGYNYTESRYQTDHVKYPKRVIYGSENRHDFEAWKAVRDNKHIFGQFLWTGIDYLGESGRWPSRGFYSGLLDFGGFIKPRGHFRQALWADKPVAYIGTYPTPGKERVQQAKDVWSAMEAENAQDNGEEKVPSMDAWPIWNYQEGQSIRVVCYTNAAKARLELNGKTIGKTLVHNDEHGIIHWDIPYANGKLEVVGLDEHGKETCRYSIQSSKRPKALRIISSEKSITANGGVAQIALQVVDEDGVPVMLSDNEVTCKIMGPADLLGLEAGDNSDMSDYTDNRQRVYHGKMIAYIRASGKAGEKVQVRFSSPWLEGVEAELEIK
ncbi:sugar-binding domain-containing protein [Pararcticibacter amylolyticus]|uniref:Glycoside hydrolase family 2 n=1 Tax=Pararcticibacter amylolyticus TaxID=2173175 RepID=A0A2U2PAI5_9SPHI|nr:sugar-binding domain-containing protein [Pararcticibacter amylolyticus]PWG78370.1 glycoside hydrolase family 2 [Pararcticibacter amylolyticus]